MKRGILPMGLAVLLSGCSTYQFAKDVKMMSFEETPKQGTRVGEIRGADCVWSVMGYKMGGEPTLDKAFTNARSQKATGITEAVAGPGKTDSANDIAYLEQISTSRDGFNAGIVGKDCLVVKGVAYK